MVAHEPHVRTRKVVAGYFTRAAAHVLPWCHTSHLSRTDQKSMFELRGCLLALVHDHGPQAQSKLGNKSEAVAMRANRLLGWQHHLHTQLHSHIYIGDTLQSDRDRWGSTSFRIHNHISFRHLIAMCNYNMMISADEQGIHG